MLGLQGSYHRDPTNGAFRGVVCVTMGRHRCPDSRSMRQRTGRETRCETDHETAAQAIARSVASSRWRCPAVARSGGGSAGGQRPHLAVERAGDRGRALGPACQSAAFRAGLEQKPRRCRRGAARSAGNAAAVDAARVCGVGQPRAAGGARDAVCQSRTAVSQRYLASGATGSARSLCRRVIVTGAGRRAPVCQRGWAGAAAGSVSPRHAKG